MNSGKVYNNLKYKLNNDIIKIIQKYNIVNVKKQYNLVKYSIKESYKHNLSKPNRYYFFYCLFCDEFDWDNYSFTYGNLHTKIMKLYSKNLERMCIDCYDRCYSKYRYTNDIKREN